MFCTFRAKSHLRTRHFFTVYSVYVQGFISRFLTIKQYDFERQFNFGEWTSTTKCLTAYSCISINLLRGLWHGDELWYILIRIVSQLGLDIRAEGRQRFHCCRRKEAITDRIRFQFDLKIFAIHMTHAHNRILYIGDNCMQQIYSTPT